MWNKAQMTAYESLAHAIIQRDVLDYRRAKHNARRQEIARFFKSGWFTALSNIDGNLLLQKLEEERELKKAVQNNDRTRDYQAGN